MPPASAARRETEVEGGGGIGWVGSRESSIASRRGEPAVGGTTGKGPACLSVARVVGRLGPAGLGPSFRGHGAGDELGNAEAGLGSSGSGLGRGFEQRRRRVVQALRVDSMAVIEGGLMRGASVAEVAAALASSARWTRECESCARLVSAVADESQAIMAERLAAMRSRFSKS